MIQTDGAIGVMDSGVGGVSVLRALRFALPQENFIYFSDRANAPYGIKPPEIIKKWVGECAELLTECGVKALVIACNTATSVAVEEMRRRYGEMPVVGLEPAVRPAVRYAMGNGGDVLVLATGVTLGQERFKGLCRCISKELGAVFINPYYGDEIAMDAAVSNEKRVSVYSVAAQGIVGYVERGMGNSSELSEYLKGVLFPYRGLRFSAVVAGCTHFPFARDSIISALGYAPEFFDGGIGAANRMKKLLGDKKMLRNEGGGIGWTLWLSSDARGSYPEYSGLLRNLMRVEK